MPAAPNPVKLLLFANDIHEKMAHTAAKQHVPRLDIRDGFVRRIPNFGLLGRF
jgi:capsule polysaccharide export protein KpsC/LpsZ